MQKLFSYNSYAIFSHIRPDGDTVGSALGLYYALKNMGKDVELFVDSPIPKMLQFLDGAKLYSTTVPTKKFDAYIAIDCGDITRLGAFASLFSRAQVTYNIDHHKSNNGYAKVNHIRILSSACEIVYNLLKANDIEITKEIATVLYCGLFTDTGGFTHSSTTPAVHLMAADLMRFNLDVADLAFKLLKEKSLAKFKMSVRVMQKVKLLLDNRLAVLTILAEDLAECGCADNDTEGFIDIGTSIEGTLAAVSIMEFKPNSFKIGFRSKTDSIDVSLVASRFGGGGHLRAAGCLLNGYYEDVLDKLVRAIADFL